MEDNWENYPQTKRPIKIAFIVDDVKAAVDFYTTVLDLEVMASYPSDLGAHESYVSLKSQSIFIELLPKKAMGGAPVGFHHLAFWSGDVQHHLDCLRDRGAKVTSKAFSAGIAGITLGDFEGPGDVLLRLFNQAK